MSRRFLDTKLSVALEPVSAPAELWERVETALAPATPRRSTKIWASLLMAATVAALLSGGVLYLRAQTPATSNSLTSAALRIHSQAAALDPSHYAVQRYSLQSGPVTVVFEADAGLLTASPGKKSVRTIQSGNTAVSEWTSGGRRWAMVSSAASHNHACAVCHRA